MLKTGILRNQVSIMAAGALTPFASRQRRTIMVTSSNGNTSRVTSPLCGEFTDPRWVPRTKANDGALMFSLICARIIAWVNNREAGDLRRHRAHSDVILMMILSLQDKRVVVFQVESLSTDSVTTVWWIWKQTFWSVRKCKYVFNFPQNHLAR